MGSYTSVACDKVLAHNDAGEGCAACEAEALRRDLDAARAQAHDHFNEAQAARNELAAARAEVERLRSGSEVQQNMAEVEILGLKALARELAGHLEHADFCGVCANSFGDCNEGQKARAALARAKEVLGE